MGTYIFVFCCAKYLYGFSKNTNSHKDKLRDFSCIYFEFCLATTENLCFFGAMTLVVALFCFAGESKWQKRSKTYLWVWELKNIFRLTGRFCAWNASKKGAGRVGYPEYAEGIKDYLLVIEDKSDLSKNWAVHNGTEKQKYID